jgi:hypothetical protein
VTAVQRVRWLNSTVATSGCAWNAGTGTGGATVNMLATSTLTNVFGNGPNTTVNVGNAGFVQNIRPPIPFSDSLPHVPGRARAIGARARTSPAKN